MSEFRLLKEEEYQDNKDFLKTENALTDLAILTGAEVYYYYSNLYEENTNLHDGQYWTDWQNWRDFNETIMVILSEDSQVEIKDKNDTEVAVRVVMDYKSLDDVYTNGQVNVQIGNVEFEYGYYPQTVATREIQDKLEKSYYLNELNETGNYYTIYKKMYDSAGNYISSEKEMLKEYEYNGKRYVRVEADSCHDDGLYLEGDFKLSDGLFHNNGEFIFIEVEPIKWIYNKDTGLIVSKNLLIAGIDYDKIKEFLNTDFIKEIKQDSVFYYSNEESFDLGEVEKDILLKEIDSKNFKKSSEELKNKIKKISKEKSNYYGKYLIAFLEKTDLDDWEEWDILRNFIYKGANVNKKNDEGLTPLMICAINNHYYAFQDLLKAGAFVDEKDNNLNTCAMICAEYNRVEMLQLLILLNANINSKNINGETALMIAKKFNNIECFKLLLENGAYLNVENNNGEMISQIEGNIVIESQLQDDNDLFEEALIDLGILKDRKMEKRTIYRKLLKYLK